ncbi:MAG: binding domain protein, partial [Sphingomonas bacterium]|nr:binding domain protein [Sphingomonas bacterium]
MSVHEVAGTRAELPASVIAELRALFGDRLHLGEAVRLQHGGSESHFAAMLPDAVVFVHSTEEVAALVTSCVAAGVPIIPFGAGTSVEGNTLPVRGGVSVDLSEMAAIIQVNAEDFDCVVQAGVRREQLNEHLRDVGLFFPIDPGANATIGGMASTRASGTNAVRYGTMKDNVLAVTAVTANGEEIRTARRARKSSAGYDLTRLLVGAEGTLGVLTSITLRLQGIPEEIAGGYCNFPTLKQASEAVIMTIQLGIPVARIELLNTPQVRACNAYSKLDLPEMPSLFLEFHGSPASVALQSEAFSEIAAENGSNGFTWTRNPEERAKLWKARHDVYWSAKALRVGGTVISTDVCLPISRLADCVTETERDIEEHGLLGPIVGHAGDGNFHVSL